MRFATSKSGAVLPKPHPHTTPAGGRLPVGAVRRCAPLLAFCFWFALLSMGSAVEGKYSATALERFQQAQAKCQDQPRNGEAAWQLARASFDLAEFATNRTERAEIAEKGIAAARQALAQDADSAPGHYYLGMDLGQLARTRGLSALRLVDQMEREFSRARELDAHFDHAGPDRNLGLLYRDAPSIASIGSRRKARQHLEQAVALAPDFPENHLNLIESWLKWGQRAEAHRQLKALEEVWPAARTQYTGGAWAASWADWESRLDKVKNKLGESVSPLVAPRLKE